MANGELNITGGPSTWDMATSFFERKDSKSVRFEIDGWKTDMAVELESLACHRGSGSGWRFHGKIHAGPAEFAGQEVHGYFDTRTRKGKMKIADKQVDPPEHEEYEVSGIKVTKEFGLVVAVNHGVEVRLGQKVISNGQFAVENNAWGIVVGLAEPYTGGRTTDIIEVWFENKRSPCSMKFKDLRF